MKVELTQAQANFIESFKEKDKLFNDEKVEIGESLPLWASHAIYNISRFGYGFGIKDGNGEEVSSHYENPDHYEEFNHDSKTLLISAVINGYTVKQEEFVLYIEFEDNAEALGKRRLYYGVGDHVTKKQTATIFPCQRDYEKLIEQGWKKEVL